jgi:hypothetical protein
VNARIDRWLFAYALVAWCVAIIAQLAIDMPLRHDEAAYVVGAQRWLSGAPDVWLYRSLGTELLVLPGVAAHASPTWIRVVPALFTLLVPIGTWALARVAFPGRNVGGWAAAVIATSQPMLVRSAEILGDLPAAGLLLVGLAILLREIDRPSWKIAFAAVAFAAGFYVRYGSAPALVTIAGATVLLFPRPRALLILGGTAAVLAIPYVWFSHAQTGETLGVLQVAAHSTKLDYVGEGLVTYATSNPFAYYGVLAAPLMVLGLYGTFASRDRRALYLGLVAIITLVVLGLRSHAQPRYAFLVVALLVVVGASQLARLLAARPRAQLAAAIGIVVVAIGSVAWLVYTQRARVTAPAQIAKLGEAIRKDAGGRPCRLDAVRTPQLVYYSGCLPTDWPDAPTSGHRYIVSLPSHPAEPPPGATPLPGTSGTVLIAE